MLPHASRGSAATNCRPIERPIQPHFHQPDLFALAHQAARPLPRPRRRRSPSSRSRAPHRARRRTRTSDTAARSARRNWSIVRCTIPGTAIVKRIARLAGLEEHIRILRRAAQHRPVGIRAPARGAPGSDRVVDHPRARRRRVSCSILFTSCDVRNPSKKCRNGTRDSQRGRMRDEREVLRFLDGVRREHRPARAAAGHHVAVIAEDRQGMRGDRAGRNVKDRRRQFAGDLEHLGDHQQQALRGGERRASARPPGEHRGRLAAAPASLCISMTSGTLPKMFGRPCGRPMIRQLAHRRGGRDRIDRDHFAGEMGNMRAASLPSTVTKRLFKARSPKL